MFQSFTFKTCPAKTTFMLISDVWCQIVPFCRCNRGFIWVPRRCCFAALNLILTSESIKPSGRRRNQRGGGTPSLFQMLSDVQLLLSTLDQLAGNVRSERPVDELVLSRERGHEVTAPCRRFDADLNINTWSRLAGIFSWVY